MALAPLDFRYVTILSMPGSPRTITWATFAGTASNPMGLQHYEIQILRGLEQLGSSEWQFQPRPIASVRGGATSTRIPMGLLSRSSPQVARLLGRWAYRGAERVHRFDFGLPPASVPELVTVHDLPPL